MRKICYFLILGSLLLTLTGCMGNSFAPVDEGWQKPRDVGGVYQVKQGETLQDIAWRFNLNAKRLAKLNDLTPPYSLHKGQILYLTSQAKTQGQNTATEQTTTNEENQTNSSSLSTTSTSGTTESSESHLTPEPVQPEVSDKAAPAGAAGGVTSMIDADKAQNVPSTTKKSSWQWPINGQVVGNFSDGTKGLEIKGQAGEKVAASRGGQVVYAGNGLPGYGNLVIVKHPDGLMSVYAQNRKLLVKEGEHVQAGQAVAEVGDNSKLHFEIRKDGKPVDPSTYLGN